MDENLAKRLQAIDEQIACEQDASLPEDASRSQADPLNEIEIDRVKDVFHLINRLRKRQQDQDLDPSAEARETLNFPRAGFQFGNYLVEQEIARGGMGIVFQARDLRLNRQVALKILRSGPLALQADRIRFRGEAEAAARLDHPGIVPVYEVGDQDGVLYFTMGIVNGPSLSELVRASPLDPVRAAAIAKQIAESAEYAHQHGIVHRDLKPSNVLFDQFDRVRVADFGLARRIDSGSELTETGQVVGTPEYMAPEQAAGNASTAGPSADIYSIGATLYCMLTGQPPFRSPSSAQTLRRVIEQEPIALRNFNRLIPADLETICLRCLEKQPAKRYVSAALLAQDLGRFLVGEPIAARRPSVAERGLRWCRRHPLAALLIGLLSILAIVGPIIATNQMQLTLEARQARDAMLRTLYVSDMNLAMRDWDEANLQRCGQLLRRHLPVPGQPDLRGFEWHYLWRNWQLSQQVPVVFADEQLETIAVSPDQAILAVGCFDGKLILWDLKGNRTIRQWQAHPYRTYRLDFSGDGKTLGSASIDNEVTLWDVATGTALQRFSGSRAISLSPIDDSFAYRTQGRYIHLHHSYVDEPARVIDAAPEFIETITHSFSGHQIASAGWDGQIKTWDAKSGQPIKTMAGTHPSIWAIAWSADDFYLAGGDVKGIVRLWDSRSGEMISVFTGHTETIHAVAFSPDGTLLVSASADNTVDIRSLVTGQLIRKLKVHSGEVHSIAFIDQGRSLLTASADGTVKKWRLDGPQGVDVLEHPALVTSLAFFPDGKQIATACYDGIIRCWNVADGTLQHQFVAHESNVWRIKLINLDDRTLILSSGQDGALKIWDARTGQMIQKLDAKPNSLDPLSFAVSPDHSLLAYPNSAHVITVFDLRSHRDLVSFTPGTLSDLVFSPDGKRLLACSETRMSLWDTANGRLLKEWPGGSRLITRVQYAPDGNRFAAATYDRLVKIWETNTVLGSGSESPKEQKVLTGSSGILSALAYSSDGSILASAGDDQVIRLWDSYSGQQRAALRGHSASVVDLAFSPDDQVLASASSDHTVRLWRGDRATVERGQ